MQDHLLNQLDTPASKVTRQLVKQAKGLGRLSDELSSELGFSVSVCRAEGATLVLQVHDGSLATRLRYRSQSILPRVETVLKKPFTNIDIRVGSQPGWASSDEGVTEWARSNREPTPISKETSALLAEQAELVSDPRLKRAFEALSSRRKNSP